VIAAAGSGERLGAGGPKALVRLAGRPILAHSLLQVRAAARLATAVVAAPAGHEAEVERLLVGIEGLGGVVVAGGESRAASVRAGLALVETELVLIHDAARPLVRAALFDAVAARLEGRPDAAAVVAAAPILDTVKRSVGPRSAGAGAAEVVAETVPREDLWAAQTPQGFRVAELRAAQAAAEAAGELEAATDEARLIERHGGTVLLEPAPAENLKVTGPEDLSAAEALLAARQRV
jgi:2-C-methyl-D-erythritol 4-phosphate cytidylyltransferase